MAVAVTATSGVASQGGTNTNGVNGIINVASGTTLLIAIMGCYSGIPTGVTVTWDDGGTNQAMTAAGNALNGANCQIWVYGLVNPTTGGHNIKWAWTGTTQTSIAAMTMTGTSVASVAAAILHVVTNTGNSGTGTDAGVSAAGNLCVAGVISDTQSIGSISATSSTQMFTSNQIGGAYVAGASSVSWSSSQNSSNWAFISVDVSVPVIASNPVFPRHPIQIWDH